MYDLNDFQTDAVDTWHGKLPGTEAGRSYLALKLAGEAGEVAEKCGKLIRDKNGLVDVAPEDVRALVLELGDVLWYLTVLADEFGVTLNDVAKFNRQKLADRKARGVIRGNGDNR